jgi:hypothetical protein
VRERTFGVPNLTSASLLPELLEDLDHLTGPRRTERVTLRFEASRTVHGGASLVSSPATFPREGSAFAHLGQTKVFGRQQLGDGEAIVHFRQVKVLRPEACRCIGLRCSLLRCW